MKIISLTYTTLRLILFNFSVSETIEEQLSKRVAQNLPKNSAEACSPEIFEIFYNKITWETSHKIFLIVISPGSKSTLEYKKFCAEKDQEIHLKL